MSSRRKKEEHRVICMCTSFNCYRAEFVDAHGVRQVGLEVLPETKVAHERAALRERARTVAAEMIPSNSGPTLPQAQRVQQATTDDLISPLSCLDLSSRSSGSLGTRNEPKVGFSLNESRRDLIRDAHTSVSDQTCRSARGNTQGPAVCTPAAISKTCQEALSAKYSGMKVYNCGKLF